MRRCRTAVLGAAAILIAAAISSRAEEERSKDDLPELLVTAPPDAVTPPHFAGSATIIDAATLNSAGVRSVADLLASRGGVRLSSTSGNSSDATVHLRGFGENSSSRVLVLVDGRPMNRPDMAGVSWLEIPLSQLASVEILRGSQTARFGDNAVGGVINLVTKPLGGPPVTTLEAAGGSDGYQLLRLGHRRSIDGHELSLDLEHNVTDGWRDNAASELDSAALHWRKKTNGVEFRGGFAWSHELGGFPGPLSEERYRDDPRQSIYTLGGLADQYFSEQTGWRADASVLLETAHRGTFEIPLDWSRRDQEWNLGPGSHANNLLDTVTLAPQWRLEGQHASLTLGANYRHDELDVDQFAQISRRDRTATAGLSRDVTGLFSTAAWEPWRGWHLQGAARIERASVDARARSFVFPTDPALNFSREGDETNEALQLGLRWEPRDDLAAWFRYDRLYRLPSTDEIASYQGYPLTTPFNDRLQAETGHNLELGVEYRPGPWEFRLNAFAQWLEGEIAYDYVQNLNVNLADTRRLGVEAELGYRAHGWEAELRATYLSAEFASGPYAGKNVYLVPRFEASAVLACHPWEPLTLQAEYQYAGAAYEGNDFLNTEPQLPAYGVTNLLVRYEPRPGLSFHLRIDNLFDERYATVKYSGVWYPAAGRQFQVGVRREF